MWKRVWNVAAVLGVVFGALSIVMLAKQAIDFGFVAPLQAMLDWYDHVTATIFSPLRPILEGLARLVSYVYPVEIQLQEEWPHILVATLVTGGAALRMPERAAGWAFAFVIGIIGIPGMFDAEFANGWGVSGSLGALSIIVAWAVIMAFQSGDRRAALDFVKSLAIVLGGAALFVALNAGLKIAGF